MGKVMKWVGYKVKGYHKHKKLNSENADTVACVVQELGNVDFCKLKREITFDFLILLAYIRKNDIISSTPSLHHKFL